MNRKLLFFVVFLALSPLAMGSQVPGHDTTLAAAIQTATPFPVPVEDAITQLKIGDYVQFGRYNDQPILWRVIEDSANPDAVAGDVVLGDPLLFSDTSITQKPFDAAGPHGGNADRLEGGSNLWRDSNLRAWLNSSAEAGAVEWLCGNPPTEGNVSSNPYADEKGFLADGNFTEYERGLIVPVMQKALLYDTDKDLAEGGSVAYRYHGEIEDIVNNYDDAYYQNVTDRIFLLDPKQINGVYRRFHNYYYYNSRGSVQTWLRAPDTYIYTDSSAANVLYVGAGPIYYASAKNGGYGVRPALTLDLELIVFGSGDGSAENPYVLSAQ